MVFSEFLDRYGDLNLEKLLPAFTEYRYVDAHSICDLAMYNFIEVSYFLCLKKCSHLPLCLWHFRCAT